MTIREQAILICDIAASDVYFQNYYQIRCNCGFSFKALNLALAAWSKAEDAHGDWSRATDAEAAQLLRDGFRPG